MADARERVLAAVDALSDEVVDFTSQLVRLPTVNPPGEGYEECARVIGDRLKRGGFAVEYLPAEGRPEHTASHPRLNVMGTRPGRGKGPVVHFKRRDWQICDTESSTRHAIAVPLKPGGILLFQGLIQHGTPANNSGMRRRAVQFHYRPKSAPMTSEEERMKVFGGEVRGATC